MSLKIEEIKILEQEPMCKHTTFRIGGAAKYFAMPKNTAEIQTLIAYCKEHKLDYCVLGNGSNVLFTDAGYDGLIIQIGSAMVKSGWMGLPCMRRQERFWRAWRIWHMRRDLQAWSSLQVYREASVARL